MASRALDSHLYPTYLAIILTLYSAAQTLLRTDSVWRDGRNDGGKLRVHWVRSGCRQTVSVLTAFYCPVTATGPRPAPPTPHPALDTPPRPPTAPGPPSGRTWRRSVEGGRGGGGGSQSDQTDHWSVWPLNWLWDVGHFLSPSGQAHCTRNKYFSSPGQTDAWAEGSLPRARQAPGRHQPTEGKRDPAPTADILQRQPGRPLQCRLRSDWLQLLISTIWPRDLWTRPRKLHYPSIDFLAPLGHFSPKFCYFLMNSLCVSSIKLSPLRCFQFWPQLICNVWPEKCIHNSLPDQTITTHKTSARDLLTLYSHHIIMFNISLI